MNELRFDPYVKYILCQREKKDDTRKVDFRNAIVEKQIILINLPLDRPGFQEVSRVIGTFLLSAIYEATFSFDDMPEGERPGFTLIVDEFDNFATSDYERFFTKARSMKVKQFLAHQYRHQLDREGMGTNRQATLSAHTVIAMKTTPEDAKDKRGIAGKFEGLTRRPTNIHPLPLEKKGEWLEHSSKSVREFYLYIQALEDRGAEITKKRLNTFLYTVQDRGKVESSELEAMLLGLAEVLGKASRRQQKNYNQDVARRIEQTRVRKKELEDKYNRKVEELSQKRYEELCKEIAGEVVELRNRLAALGSEEERLERAFDNLSAREREILKQGDENIQQISLSMLNSDGFLEWDKGKAPPIEVRINAYIKAINFKPRYVKSLDGRKIYYSPLSTSIDRRKTLAWSKSFPWNDFTRLAKLREAIKNNKNEQSRLSRRLALYKYVRADKDLIAGTDEYWRLDREYNRQRIELSDLEQKLSRDLYSYSYTTEIDQQFKQQFVSMVRDLIENPIASDKPPEIDEILINLKQRRALVNIDGVISEMTTIDLNKESTKEKEEERLKEVYTRRIEAIRKRTREVYCRERSQVESEIYSLFEQKEEQKPEPERGQEKQADSEKQPPAEPDTHGQDDEQEYRRWTED